MMKKYRIFCFLVGFLYVFGLFPAVARTDVSARSDSQEVKAVWAATLYSLDYPKSPTTSESSLKADADNLLNNVQEMGYTDLFLQVRSAGDAFYDSDIFPWSKYLTGAAGQAPENGFDPLEYIIREAHKKGISVHAWINPYRLTASANDKSKLSENSVPKKYPDITVEHTDGKLYLNPGEPEAQKLVVDGVTEILKNYDVDGIHIDDYFYPGSDFPDGEAFAEYGGGFENIGDWRRNNTKELVKALQKAVKSEKPEAVFSVSPCGIWANESSHPLGSKTNGKQAYFDYYADSRLWVKEELVDWIMPQIYWNRGFAVADFVTLANWWQQVASDTDVKLCIGQSVYKAADATDSSSVWYGQNGIEELEAQIEIIRSLENSNGYSHYRLGSILKSDEMKDFARKVNSAEESLGQEPEEPEKPIVPENPEKIPDPVVPEVTPEEAVPEEPQENTEEKDPGFSDLARYSWAREAVISLYNKGIVRGMDDGSFGCVRKVTRADFTVMLVRLLDEKDVAVTSNFEDVSPAKYYYPEIGVAKALGITNGRDGRIFDPSGNITRQDMATMVFRILEKYEKLNYDENISLDGRFSDAEDIADYAEEAVGAMCDMNLLSGYETGEFLPAGLATRAETAVFLDRVSKLFE